MRTWWFLALMVAVSAAAAGCQKTAENGADNDSRARVGKRTQRSGELDYDSYARTRSQRKLQDIEDAEDAQQDDPSGDERTADRSQTRTTRRPPTGRSDRLSGLEDEEPEEAMLEAKRSRAVTEDDYFKLGTSGRLDEESLDEDQTSADIVADEEDDPRRR
jgi:hypothetical protein